VNAIWLSRDWPEIEVLYEDDDLMAINKRVGLLVAPDRWDKKKENVMGLLQATQPAQYLANVHRLDKNTSGVFLLAKNKPALVKLVRQFSARTTHKTYAALIHGAPLDDTTTIDLPISPHFKRAGLSRIDRKAGKPAMTIARVAERFPYHTLLNIELHTGRLHQVRVHLQAIGCPLVGDADYGGEPLLLSQIKPKYKAKDGEVERPLLDRPALHAEELTVQQPTTNEPVTIRAPWPKDLTVAVKYLRMFAQG
jgi:RluA family pseudouridine synthase